MRRSPERGKLAMLAAVVAALALAMGIAACGDGTVGGGGNEGDVTTAKAGPVSGELMFSNWPGYIDPGKNGTVAEFEDETGVSVDYVEDINSNDAFFGKMQPLLEGGDLLLAARRGQVQPANAVLGPRQLRLDLGVVLGIGPLRALVQGGGHRPSPVSLASWRRAASHHPY